MLLLWLLLIINYKQLIAIRIIIHIRAIKITINNTISNVALWLQLISLMLIAIWWSIIVWINVTSIITIIVITCVLINANIINALDKASDPWGLKITRYEIANITPPKSVQDALEKQMRAERERRSQIALSEGEREAAINVAEGHKQQVIKESEAQQLR